MINDQEATELMIKLIDLRRKVEANPSDAQIKKYFAQHERICIEKFKYIVTMHTNRYRNFPNYEDLLQEGFEALLKGMKNYDPAQGPPFWWFHKYVQTRVVRSANLHTTIRYPLKFAKDNIPHKESQIPVMIEQRFNPDKQLEESQLSSAVKNAMSRLDNQEKDIVELAFGFGGEKPLSITRICKLHSVSRQHCAKVLGKALGAIKDNIKL